MAKKPAVKKKNTKKKTALANQIAGLPSFKELAVAKPKKETLTEKVLNERNLIVAPLPEHTAPVAYETERGKVRIEGEVTPQKLALAKQFEQIFAASTEEIMDLAAFTPNPDTMDFVKSAGLTNKQVEEIKEAKPWATFQIKGETLMKTSDNKLENVKNYFYRLERAVINQINLRKQAESRIELLEKEAKELKDEVESLLTLTRKSFEEANKPSSFLLPIKRAYDSLVTFVLKLLS